MRNLYFSVITFFIFFLISYNSLLAQNISQKDSINILNESRIDSSNKEKLYAIKKELLLHRLNYQQSGTQLLFENQWRLRVTFLLFIGSFLTLSLSSEKFKNLAMLRSPKFKEDFAGYFRIFGITFLLFAPFFIFDSQLGRQQDRRVEVAKEAEVLLNDLENKSYIELKAIMPYPEPEYGKFIERWCSRLSQFKKIEYSAFYSLAFVLWIIGWYLKERKK